MTAERGPRLRRIIGYAQGMPPFEDLLQKNLPAIRALVRLRSSAPLRAHESVSDLVQSTCREALRHAERLEYRGEGSFREWLATIALNKLRERERFLRAAKRDVRRERQDAGADAE